MKRALDHHQTTNVLLQASDQSHYIPNSIEIDSEDGKLMHPLPPLAASNSFCGLALTTTLTFPAAVLGLLMLDDKDDVLFVVGDDEEDDNMVACTDDGALLNAAAAAAAAAARSLVCLLRFTQRIIIISINRQ